MKVVQRIEEAVNSLNIPDGSVIYTAGNAATPQVILRQLAIDSEIKNVSLLSVLLLGNLGELFSKETCKRITHRVIFNGPHSREAMNTGGASYQLIHLSDIPRQLKSYLKPTVVFLSVAGPDNGGNFSFGTTVEGCKAAVEVAKSQGGIVIAERNAKMPFVLGTTLHKSEIDFLIDMDYHLPQALSTNPTILPDVLPTSSPNFILPMAVHSNMASAKFPRPSPKPSSIRVLRISAYKPSFLPMPCAN